MKLKAGVGLCSPLVFMWPIDIDERMGNLVWITCSSERTVVQLIRVVIYNREVQYSSTCGKRAWKKSEFEVPGLSYYLWFCGCVRWWQPNPGNYYSNWLLEEVFEQTISIILADCVSGLQKRIWDWVNDVIQTIREWCSQSLYSNGQRSNSFLIFTYPYLNACLNT